MIRCTACGLELPAHARFCAHCGTRVAPAGFARYSPWIALLFGFGVVLGLLGAFGYWSLVGSPGLMAARGIDPAQGQPIAAFFAVWATLLVVVQVVAAIGLVLGRSWARPVATAACALWFLTCVGAPLSLLVIYLLWRRPRQRSAPGGPPPEPGTLGR